MSELTFLIITYGHKKCQIDLVINSLLCQTCPEWKAFIIHDGPSEECRSWVEAFNDPRVMYKESAERMQYWGHPNRKEFMKEVETEWMTWGNADNYYMPTYVEWMKGTGDLNQLEAVVTNICHNYPNVNGRNDIPYSILEAAFGINRVDWISYIVRTDVAKKVGLNHAHFIGADGMFIEDLKRMCYEEGREARHQILRNTLAVHN